MNRKRDMNLVFLAPHELAREFVEAYRDNRPFENLLSELNNRGVSSEVVSSILFRSGIFAQEEHAIRSNQPAIARSDTAFLHAERDLVAALAGIPIPIRTPPQTTAHRPQPSEVKPRGVPVPFNPRFY